MLHGKIVIHQNGIQMDLKTRLIEVIKKSTGEEIKMNSHFIDNLGFDSLTVVEMVMNMEDEFNIEITDDEVSKLSTVQTAYDLLEKKNI